MKGKDKVKFIIYGDGDQRIPLEEAVKNKGLLNIIFKGRVEKKMHTIHSIQGRFKYSHR